MMIFFQEKYGLQKNLEESLLLYLKKNNGKLQKMVKEERNTLDNKQGVVSTGPGWDGFKIKKKTDCGYQINLNNILYTSSFSLCPTNIPQRSNFWQRNPPQ